MTDAQSTPTSNHQDLYMLHSHLSDASTALYKAWRVSSRTEHHSADTFNQLCDRVHDMMNDVFMQLRELDPILAADCDKR